MRRKLDESTEAKPVFGQCAKCRIFGIFWSFWKYFLGPSTAHSFTVCRRGPGVALTPGVELPGVRPPGAGVSAQALAP